MKFALVKLARLSGTKASIFSIRIEGDEFTLFERFVLENKSTYPDEVKDISTRLLVIGHHEGAREQYFKPNEGKPGDGLCALFDIPEKYLRLYCIRYGSTSVILGGGGPKSKEIRAFQEDEKLTKENYLLRRIANVIHDALKNREVRWSYDGMDLEGDLNFDDYED